MSACAAASASSWRSETLDGLAGMPQRALEIVHEQGSPRELGKDGRLESHVASHLEQRALRGAEPGRRLHALAREDGEPPQRVGPLVPLGEPIDQRLEHLGRATEIARLEARLRELDLPAAPIGPRRAGEAKRVLEECGARDRRSARAGRSSRLGELGGRALVGCARAEGEVERPLLDTDRVLGEPAVDLPQTTRLPPAGGSRSRTADGRNGSGRR